MLYTENSFQAAAFREKSDAIRGVLRHAVRAPYYRTLLEGATDVGDYAAFLRIPTTNADALRRYANPDNPAMFTGPIRGCYIFSTGGMTGRPKLTYREFNDFEVNRLYFRGLDIGPSDVVANLFTPGIWGTFTSHNKGLERLGCTIVPLGAYALQEGFAHTLDTLFETARINAVIATPSICISLGNKLCAAARRAVTKIYCIGEMMYPATHTALAERFPNARVHSAYGTVDITGVGCQCAHLEGAAYHPMEDVFLEMIDEDGSPVPDGTTGRLIVTNLRHRIIPMIRYDVNDIGFFEAADCPGGCGRPVFRVTGRAAGSLIIASAIVQVESFGEALSSVRGATGRFRIVLTKEDGLDGVCWEFECGSSGVAEGAALDALKRLEPELAACISEGKCHEVAVKLLAPGSLEHVGISGKTRKVIDRRAETA